MKEEVFSIEKSSKVFLWSIFLPQVLSLVLIIILSGFYKTLEELSGSVLYIISMLLVAQVGFALIAFRFAKKNNIPVKQKTKENFKNVSFVNVLVCVLISVIAISGLVNFIGIFDTIWEGIGYESSSIGLLNTNFGWFLLDVVLSCAIPAVMEEIVFRGIIFNGLKKLGFWAGAIISSVMFMLVHLSLGSLVYPVIMGIVFCLVYNKTKNILYPMIIHFCNNFIVKLIEYFNVLTGNNFGMVTISAWWHYVLVIIGAILAVVIIYLLIKYLIKNNKPVSQVLAENKAQQQENIENLDQLQVKTDEILQKRKNNIYLYGSLAIGFVFWVIMIVLSIV